MNLHESTSFGCYSLGCAVLDHAAEARCQQTQRDLDQQTDNLKEDRHALVRQFTTC
jgi:hypothetical protein